MRNMLRLRAAPGLFLCLALLLALPAAALEAGGTVRVTCDYPEELCSFAVRVPNEEQTWPLDSDIPYDEGKDYVWLAFEIEDIAQGWRIKSVLMNGVDRTESFVNGGYGDMATYIRADTAVQVELEEIPATLPSVTGVELYTDEACTQAAPENVSYGSGSGAERLYGKGTYSDGIAYPSYYGTGQWEYSTDGVEWLPARTWGSNRWDFWPGWEYHTELDFLLDSYDLRLCAEADDIYTTGPKVYSNVIHVNGGASGKEPVELAGPTDLTWDRYRPDDTVDIPYKGMISWKEDTSQPEHTTWIAVWRKGENGAADEKVFESGHIVRTGAPLWREEHDFVCNRSAGLRDGVYYFTLQAKGDGTSCADSETVRSGDWTYTAPGRQLDAPAKVEWSWPRAAWTPSDDPCAGGYIAEFYYSAENDGITDADAPGSGAERVGGYVWWFGEGKKTPADAFYDITDMTRFLRNGAGYYYFRARTLSSNVLEAKNSPSSALSAAYYYDGGAGGSAPGAPAELRWNEDAEGRSRPGCMSWTAGADQDFLYFDIQVFDSGENQIYEGQEYCETDGNGRWCSMLLSYLDEGLLGGGLPAGDYRFRVRPTRYGEPLGEWSELSGPYSYTPPAERLEAPSGARWAGLYPLMAWTPAADGDAAFDYYVRYYYSPDDGAARDPSALTKASGTLHMSLDKNGVTNNDVFVNEQMARHGAGYYYFTVQAVSGDRDQRRNSPESPLSDAVHFDGETVTNGGSGAQAAVSQVKAGGGKLSFTVSSTNVTWGENKREGSLFLAGWRDGRLSDAAYTAKSSGDFSLSAERATVFFLEEKTWIPLAEKLMVTAE